MRFLSPKAVCEKVAFSRATLDRKVADGTFVKPVRLSQRRLAFVEADVENWMNERVEAA